MTNLSEIYDVTFKRGNREAAKGGFVRPTVGEHFMTHRDFEHVIKPPDSVFLTKILAPDGVATDYFGYSVAISDTKIVVGAYKVFGALGGGSGAAYIFNTDGSYVTKITVPNGVNSAYFGYSVAISDTKIVVGATRDSYNEGAAYIFNIDGTYVTRIIAPDGTESDYFGNSVAISDTKIVVGTYAADNIGKPQSGAAYIFNTDGTYVTKITAPDGASTDFFGNSVAISDTKIVVGAYLDDTPGGTNAGSAYIFNIDGTYVTKITAPDGAASDYFGYSVAISDTKIVVGAYQEDPVSITNAGSAYIFNTDGTYVTKITAPDGAATDYFGYSVAISDTKIVVGAYQDDNTGGTNAGSAYIFNTDGTYVTKITAPDGAADDRFGISVAISDTKIVVGAYLDDTSGGTDAGSAYIYDI